MLSLLVVEYAVTKNICSEFILESRIHSEGRLSMNHQRSRLNAAQNALDGDKSIFFISISIYFAYVTPNKKVRWVSQSLLEISLL